MSVSYKDTIICAGGSDASGHTADVFRLEWQDGKLLTTTLPPLPQPIANGCGGLVGSVLYVAGGQDSPTSTSALRTVYRLDLARPARGWTETTPCPGPGRILATAASADGAFWLMGGAGLRPDDKGAAVRTYLTDAWRYTPKDGWKRVADLPRPAVAAPTPAASDTKGIYLFGGDDGSKVGFTPIQEHPGFNTQVLRYDIKTGRWESVGTLPSAQVTVPLVRWNKGWVMPGGEVRPGVRTPDVWRWMNGSRR